MTHCVFKSTNNFANMRGLYQRARLFLRVFDALRRGHPQKDALVVFAGEAEESVELLGEVLVVGFEGERALHVADSRFVVVELLARGGEGAELERERSRLGHEPEAGAARSH